MKFHTKPLWVQNQCIFGSIKYIDLFQFMIELDILCVILYL